METKSCSRCYLEVDVRARKCNHCHSRLPGTLLCRDVEGKKLGAIGLRIRRHCSYHGLAVNVAMDLEPFGRIDPCGYEGLEVTELRALCSVDDVARFRADVTPHLLARLRLG